MAGNRCIINLLRTRRAQGIACLLLALCLTALLILALTRKPAQSSLRHDQPQGLSAYDVTLKILPDTREVSISETVTFRNRTGDALESLVLRTWLNAYETEETSPASAEELYDACYPEGFSPGYMTVHDVIWNGDRAAWAYEDEARTVLRLRIPRLNDGDEGTLTLRCVAKVPVCAHRTGVIGGAWQLGNVIPHIPLYQDHMFRTDAYSPIGDPFVSPCADYTLHLLLPEEMDSASAIACSAVLEKGQDGLWHGFLPAARDVALCLNPAYQRAETMAGGVAVYAYAADPAGAKRAAEDAKQAIETFAGLYGAYPYPSLSVCSVDFPFGGMEYSGLVMIGQKYFLDSLKDSLELTVAHEAAHQWFYALVGSDQVFSPWQDEALCQHAMLRYVQRRYGQQSFETLKYYQVDAPMMEQIPGSLTPGSPIDYFAALNDYISVVYGRGAALLLALDRLVPGGVDGFLKSYADEFAYDFATRTQFEAFLNQYAGVDCSPLLLDYLDTAQ